LGKGAIEAISSQLSKELPGLRGFSARNIKNMRTFFEGWHLLEQNNSAVTTAEFTRINKDESITSSNVNSAVVTAEIPAESEIHQLQLANLPDLKREDFKVAYLENQEVLGYKRECRKNTNLLCHNYLLLGGNYKARYETRTVGL